MCVVINWANKMEYVLSVTIWLVFQNPVTYGYWLSVSKRIWKLTDPSLVSSEATVQAVCSNTSLLLLTVLVVLAVISASSRGACYSEELESVDPSQID